MVIKENITSYEAGTACKPNLNGIYILGCMAINWLRKALRDKSSLYPGHWPCFFRVIENR